MSQKILLLSGGLSGRLLVAVLEALARGHKSDGLEAILVQPEEPVPPTTYLLRAPECALDDHEALIDHKDNAGHSLRNERHRHAKKSFCPSYALRARRVQSMTRRCKHRN